MRVDLARRAARGPGCELRMPEADVSESSAAQSARCKKRSDFCARPLSALRRSRCVALLADEFSAARCASSVRSSGAANETPSAPAPREDLPPLPPRQTCAFRLDHLDPQLP